MKNKPVVLLVGIIIFCISAVAINAQDTIANTSGYLFQQNFAQTDISTVGKDDGWGNINWHIPNIDFSAGKRVLYDGFVRLLNSEIPDSALVCLASVSKGGR